jgi:hypothetical protein
MIRESSLSCPYALLNVPPARSGGIVSDFAARIKALTGQKGCIGGSVGGSEKSREGYCGQSEGAVLPHRLAKIGGLGFFSQFNCYC